VGQTEGQLEAGPQSSCTYSNAFLAREGHFFRVRTYRELALLTQML
jgi:hypothetical protein